MYASLYLCIYASIFLNLDSCIRDKTGDGIRRRSRRKKKTRNSPTYMHTGDSCQAFVHTCAFMCALARVCVLFYVHLWNERCEQRQIKCQIAHSDWKFIHAVAPYFRFSGCVYGTKQMYAAIWLVHVVSYQCYFMSRKTLSEISANYRKMKEIQMQRFWL